MQLILRPDHGIEFNFTFSALLPPSMGRVGDFKRETLDSGWGHESGLFELLGKDDALAHQFN
jgi:hypothetical protein